MDQTIHHRIKGYELRERLGTGGFGAVYRAYQSTVGREVALKVILPSIANHPDFIRRFETEAQVIARLEHLHIVPLYDYWRDPEGAYLVMRWLKGGSLRDALESGAFDLEATVSLMDQITSALDAAHRNNIIHRDLKPANILLDEDGNAYLADFGIAKDLTNTRGSNTAEDIIVGSLDYISPEQARAALDDKKAGADPVEVLTLREQEILHLVINGLSNKEIAQRLTFTLGTVKWYVNQIYKKLHVRSRVQAIVRARELNLITSGASLDDLPTVLGVLPIPTDPFQPVNPYKGLRAFKAADHEDFFGQEKLIAKLLKRLSETAEHFRFLAVIGPSGSGKSSLVKAGLIPALWRGDIHGSERWFVAEMLPGARPLDELEVALIRVAANHSASLKEQLQRDRYGLLRVAQIILPDDDSELVLVIDQFEEVFTLVEDEAARTYFLDLIHAAVIDPRSRVRVIITLRADFYDRPLRYPEFGELVRSRMGTILPLSADGLERAIVCPAERVGVTFESGLVASIIQEIHYQPGALPLLQYALTELFEQRQGRVLTHETYQSIGKSTGALATRAEQIYAELTPELKEAARQMFLRLVTLGEGTEDTRRRVPRLELLAITSDTDLMDEVIDTFTAYRLLSLAHDPAMHTPTVEVAHEAILREWERLREWLNSSREDIRMQRQLTHLAQEWDASGQDVSFLLRGSRLEQFEKWAKDPQLAFTLHEREFLQASATHHEQEQAAERQRQAREAKLERRSQKFLRGLVAVCAVATVIAIGLSLFAFGQQRRAENARATSDANAEAAIAAQATSDRRVDESQSLVTASLAEQLLDEVASLALALALESVNIPDPPFQARQSLEAALKFAPRRIFSNSNGKTSGVAFSPDGQTVLSGSEGGGGDPMGREDR